MHACNSIQQLHILKEVAREVSDLSSHHFDVLQAKHTEKSLSSIVISSLPFDLKGFCEKLRYTTVSDSGVYSDDFEAEQEKKQEFEMAGDSSGTKKNIVPDRQKNVRRRNRKFSKKSRHCSSDFYTRRQQLSWPTHQSGLISCHCKSSQSMDHTRTTDSCMRLEQQSSKRANHKHNRGKGLLNVRNAVVFDHAEAVEFLWESELNMQVK